MANEKDRPVGYGRPPMATRFQRGRSGNPSGRPKSVISFRSELLDELGKLTRVRDGDAEIELSKVSAVAKSLVDAAVGGNLRATTALLNFFAKRSDNNELANDQAIVPADAEIIDDYEDRELRRRSNDAKEVHSELENNQQKGNDHED